MLLLLVFLRQRVAGWLSGTDVVVTFPEVLVRGYWVGISLAEACTSQIHRYEIEIHDDVGLLFRRRCWMMGSGLEGGERLGSLVTGLLE